MLQKPGVRFHVKILLEIHYDFFVHLQETSLNFTNIQTEHPCYAQSQKKRGGGLK